MTDLELERLMAERPSLADRTVALLRVLRELCGVADLDFDALAARSKKRAPKAARAALKVAR